MSVIAWYDRWLKRYPLCPITNRPFSFPFSHVKLERASATFIDPIEHFRQQHIGGAKVWLLSINIKLATNWITLFYYSICIMVTLLIIDLNIWKEGKKKFEKETTRFCSSLERHLNLSTKKSENHLQEVNFYCRWASSHPSVMWKSSQFAQHVLYTWTVDI